jgi:hypothetical protein
LKKHMFIAIGIGSVLLMLTFFSPAITNAEVNISVQAPLPPLVIPSPPGLVVIPNTHVYYPPDLNVDIFFYHGFWYRPYRDGQWYRARHYNGPWGPIVINRVPRAVIAVPPGFRRGPIHEQIPYGQLKKNWRGWERDPHWDRGRRNGEHQGVHRGEFRDRRDSHQGKEG